MTRGGLSRFRTPEVEQFPCLADVEEEAEEPSRAEAWSLWLNEYYDDGEEPFADYFARFLDEVDTTVIRQLIFELWGSPHASSEEAVRLLTGAADRFPALRLVALGDIPADECEISWIEQSDVTPLLEAFPAWRRWRSGETSWCSAPSGTRVSES
nr:hypothetical protein GCM10020093_003400 [Planobispora longispora]